MSYVSVEHEPDVWVDAHVEKRFRRGGQWRLSVYYFVGGRQYYRTYDEVEVRPVMSAELQDNLQHDEPTEPNPSEAEPGRRLSIDLREGQHNRRLD